MNKKDKKVPATQDPDPAYALYQRLFEAIGDYWIPEEIQDQLFEIATAIVEHDQVMEGAQECEDND